MLKRICSIGLLAAVGFLLAMTGFAAETSQTAIYSNSTYNFQLQYPAEWKVKEGIMSSVVAFMSPEPAGQPHFNTNILVEDGSSYLYVSLDGYVAVRLQSLQRDFKEFQLISDEHVRISNQPGRLLKFSSKDNGYDFILLLGITQYNNKAYLILSGTEKSLFPQYESTARALIDSFKFK